MLLFDLRLHYQYQNPLNLGPRGMDFGSQIAVRIVDGSEDVLVKSCPKHDLSR